LLARRPGTHCLTIWEIRVSPETASADFWKHICLLCTEASSALEVLQKCAIQIYYLLTSGLEDMIFGDSINRHSDFDLKGSRVSTVMGFHAANFGLPRPFCSRVRSKHATDRQTGGQTLCLILKCTSLQEWDIKINAVITLKTTRRQSESLNPCLIAVC